MVPEQCNTFKRFSHDGKSLAENSKFCVREVTAVAGSVPSKQLVARANLFTVAGLVKNVADCEFRQARVTRSFRVARNTHGKPREGLQQASC